MTEPRVVVSNAWDGELPGQGAWTVWYFGSDYPRFLQMSTPGRNYEVAAVGEEINAVAARVRHEFSNLDQRVASGRFLLSYAASNIAERNPLTSDLFLNVCRAIALVDTARMGGHHIAIVDEPDLGRALAKICRRAGIAAEWRGPRFSLLRYARDVVRAHTIFLRDWRAQRRATERAQGPELPSRDRAIWLLTWVDTKGIGESDEPFHGRLPAWLREAAIPFKWLGNPARWLGAIDDIASANARSAQPAVLVGAYQGFSALLRALVTLAVLPLALRSRLKLAGADVTPLLRRAISREFASSRLVLAALYAGLAAGLKRHGLAPSALIYTYENQPWEKAMLWGFRRHLPHTVMIGAQTAPFAENYLGVAPDRGQWKDGTAPDLIVTNGEAFHERLLAAGAPPERIVIGGSLRFPDVLKRLPERETDAARIVVLASCPMDLREALELAHKAAAAIAGIDGARLTINFHPKVNASFRSAVKDHVQQHVDCSNVEFVDGDAERWLEQADVLVYNSSGSVFDAAARGIPAIFVGSEIMLDLDKMSGNAAVCCRRPDEMRTLLRNLARDPALRQRSVAAMQAYLARCFAAVKSEFWIGLANQVSSSRAP